MILKLGKLKEEKRKKRKKKMMIKIIIHQKKKKKERTEEQLLTQLQKKNQQLKKKVLAKAMKQDNKEVALGTSKINYMDPRITVAWCKRLQVPIEKKKSTKKKKSIGKSNETR
eukprot:72640_1